MNVPRSYINPLHLTISKYSNIAISIIFSSLEESLWLNGPVAQPGLAHLT